MAFVPFPACLGTPRGRLPLEAAGSGAAVCGATVSSRFILRLRGKGREGAFRGVRREVRTARRQEPHLRKAWTLGLHCLPHHWLNTDLKPVFLVFWGMYGRPRKRHSVRDEFKRRQGRDENFIPFGLGPRVSLSVPVLDSIPHSALTTAHHNGLGNIEIIVCPVCSCPFVSQTGQRCGGGSITV